MSLYAFYARRPDGCSLVFAVYDLKSDVDAPALALKVLIDHPSSAYVEVWHADRRVLTRYRSRSGIVFDRPRASPIASQSAETPYGLAA